MSMKQNYINVNDEINSVRQGIQVYYSVIIFSNYYFIDGFLARSLSITKLTFESVLLYNFHYSAEP